ncbi:MAG: flagellin, partial [Pseudomonadota bacterium]
RRVAPADAQLTNLVDGTRDLRQTLLEATALGSVEGFDAILSESFSMAVSSLNTRFGNSFLFSGSRTSIPPVNVDTIEDLALLPDAFEAFENDQVRSVARIDDSLNLEFGQLASDVAEPLFAVYQRLYDFHVGPDGPLSGQLNDTQRGFLETEIAALDLAVTQVQNAQTLNGLRAANLEQTVNELTDRSFFLEEFIGSIEDVDMTKAITDLNANQTALQASYRVLGTLNEISIINFI